MQRRTSGAAGCAMWLVVAGALVACSQESDLATDTTTELSAATTSPATTTPVTTVAAPTTVATTPIVPASTTTEPAPTTEPASTTEPPTTAPATSDQPPPTTSGILSGPVDVDVGRFLEVGLFSPGDEVLSRLSARWGPPTFDSGWQGYITDWACEWGATNRELRWGGVEIILSRNDDTGESGVVGNWRYVGVDPAHDAIVLIARNGVTIGSSRDELLAAYPDTTDFGDSIDVNEGSGGFRFWLDGERIVGFGVVDCAD